jgi:hypothetical protein
MRKSDTEATVSEELRKASFGIGGKLAEFAQSSSDAEILQRVSFVFKKVQVLEVSIEELANIANELQKRAACQAAVLEYLSAGEYVCQVQQVLLASANYSVRNNASAGGSSTIDTEVLHAAIKANIDPKARVESDTTIAGDGLYYGMKFAPRCLSLLGQRPRRLPTKWHERLRSYVGLFT